MMGSEILMLLGILTFILVAWTFIDILRLTIMEKVSINLLWLLVIFMLPIIGSVLYWQLGRPSARNHKRVFRPDFNRADR